MIKFTMGVLVGFLSAIALLAALRWGTQHAWGYEDREKLAKALAVVASEHLGDPANVTHLGFGNDPKISSLAFDALVESDAIQMKRISTIVELSKSNDLCIFEDAATSSAPTDCNSQNYLWVSWRDTPLKGVLVIDVQTNTCVGQQVVATWFGIQTIERRISCS